MNSKVKICGIKREDEVSILNKYPVSYAGFIFAKSKRQVDIGRCIELKKGLREDIKSVGVFVDAPIEEVLKAVEQCGLDLVQLHGSETVDYIRQIPVAVWKTIPVKSAASIELARSYIEDVSGILFETYHKDLKGGTGERFDWTLVENLVMTKADGRKVDIILAGGLKPDNICEAKESVQPTVLDVNSGVEVEGYKNLDLINELFIKLDYIIN